MDRIEDMEGDTVSVTDALAVESELEDLLAEKLVAALRAAATEIFPRLACAADSEWLSERLEGALLEGWQSAESEWRRRYPRD